MSDTNKRIHAALDGELDPAAHMTADEAEELRAYRKTLHALEASRVTVPDGFADRVIAALPAHIDMPLRQRIRVLWPGHGRWVVPALAGAMATLLLALGVPLIAGRGGPRSVEVTFELHAPNARSVELIGSFNGWSRGDTPLQGPDATGYWSVSVPLNPGRHEYLFVIDGQQMIADPAAPFYRPDGFGRTNAVLDL